jgi:putative peptidoglycan lipid II flippase
MRLSACLGLITAANMLIWFLLQGYVFSYAGASIQADAFFASLAVPQVILAVSGSTLTHVLVPFFSGKDRAQIQEEGWALVLLLAAVFTVLALALIVTAQYWMPLIVIGFSQEAKELSVSLARIQIAGMVFSGAVSVLLSACHAQGKFMVAEAAPCISTALAFGLLTYVLPRYGVTGAAWVNVLRAFAGVALMLPFLGRPARLAFGEVSVVWSRLRPLLLSASYYKSDQLFDRFLSSMGSVGGLSLFYFAQQACVAANTVLGKAIAAPVIPRLATLAKAGDWPMFYQVYRRRLFLITGVSVLACLAAALSGSLVLHQLALVPALRQLTSAELAGLARLFILLSGVIVGGGAGLILSEAFFAKGQTRTPAAVMAVCFTGGILIKALGFSVGGVTGLALATSVYFMSYPLLLYLLIEARLARDLKVCRP